MDTGIISARYAKALYAYAVDLKEEGLLYEKTKNLSQNFTAYKSLHKAMLDPTISSEDKAKLLTTAGGNITCKSYDRFIQLITENRRQSYAPMIALMYQKIYRKNKNIITGKLTVTATPREEILEKLKVMISSESGSEVDFTTHINPDIIGGFILDVDSNQLDASIKDQLAKIKKQLITVEN